MTPNKALPRTAAPLGSRALCDDALSDDEPPYS